MLHMFTGDGHKIEKQNTCECRVKKIKKKKPMFDFVINLDRDFKVSRLPTFIGSMNLNVLWFFMNSTR